MANGATVHLPELPVPAEASTSTPIEIKIGTAVADAVATVGLAIYEYRGALDAELRSVGGNRLAKVAELQLSHERGDLDFTCHARHAGKHVLHQRYGTPWRTFYGTDLPETAFDTLIDGVLEIVGRVVRDERAFRTN